MDLQWYTMTSYKADFKNVNVIFNKDNPTNTMGDRVKSRVKANPDC
jgi:2,3-bisphosphoglycerate-independent phosphoglycerate mutase